MEALDDAVGLRALGLGAGVVDVLDRQVELVFVAVVGAAIFGAAVGQDALQRDAVLFVERQHPVVQKVGGGDRRLAVIELGEADLGVGVDEGLLIDAANALQRADVEGVLRAAIAGAFGLELAVRLLVGLGLLQRGELALGEDEALLRHLGLQRLQPVLHGSRSWRRQIERTPEGRDRHAALQQIVGDAHLAPGRLLDRQGDDGLLDLRRHPVLQDRLAARQLLQSELAAFVVKLLEAVEAVAASSPSSCRLG